MYNHVLNHINNKNVLACAVTKYSTVAGHDNMITSLSLSLYNTGAAVQQCDLWEATKGVFVLNQFILYLSDMYTCWNYNLYLLYNN